jgi:type II secretory pathway component PulK/DNA uptake protein ComE-like DNA-binding protein
MILLLVLVVVTMLALGSGLFGEWMLSEHRAAQIASRQSQARTFAESGAEVARQFLDRLPTDQQTAGGLYDNQQRFYDQIVAADETPRDQGRFTVLAPKIEDTDISGVRYGLQDESVRINLATILNYDKSSGSAASSSGTATQNSGDGEVSVADNTNAHAMLMGLPGMTDAIADCILDWIDPDDTARDQGAESEYYSSLSPPYTPRNGPPVTIDELLLVQGVTPELLFGYDAVKMGYSTSDAVSSAISGVATDNSMDHGWAQYLTLWSAESVFKSDGTEKINLNESDLSSLYEDLTSALDQESADFIVAYRLGGGTLDASNHIDTSTLEDAEPLNTISSPLDLIGVTVRGRGPSGNQVTLTNPFTSDTSAMSNYLPKLFDNCTTISGSSIPGRININQASRTVLLCIPGMTSDIADQIISNRSPDPSAPTAQADQTCPAWPLIEGIIPLAQMKTMLPYINSGGSVYRAQIIGHFDKGNPIARLEVILDATKQPTKVLFWKDMSHLSGDFRFPGETSGGTAAGQ